MPEAGELSHGQLAAIGRITCNSVAMEYVMQQLIMAFMNVKDESIMALIGSMDFRPLSVALGNVGRLKTLDDPRTWKRLDAALSKASAANDKRNTVVHSFWLASDEGTAIGWKYPRGRQKLFRPQVHEMNTDSLSAVAREIQEATVLLSKLLLDIWMRNEVAEEKGGG